MITDFILKSTFFMFFMKENRPNSHARSYSIWILIFLYILLYLTRSQSWDTEPKLRYSDSGSSQKFRLLAAGTVHNTCEQKWKLLKTFTCHHYQHPGRLECTRTWKFPRRSRHPPRSLTCLTWHQNTYRQREKRHVKFKVQCVSVHAKNS
jgi:hypothetical protein